jgi:hypothetical protein
VTSQGVNGATMPGDPAQREAHYKAIVNADRKLPPAWLRQVAHRAYL